MDVEKSGGLEATALEGVGEVEGVDPEHPSTAGLGEQVFDLVGNGVLILVLGIGGVWAGGFIVDSDATVLVGFGGNGESGQAEEKEEGEAEEVGHGKIGCQRGRYW